MPEKNKGGGFRSLFIRDTEPTQNGNSQQDTSSGTGIKLGGGGFSPSSYTPAPIQDKNLIETFVQKLQELINQNNQPGFDFLEFSETLFEESQNPDSEVFKMVYRIATKMDKSLTPARLIESAGFYKNLVQQAADSEISKGQTKKSNLQGEKETERKSLEKTQKDTNAQIEQLESQILELRTQSTTAGNQLAAIDQKYNEQFTDIDTKISAINTAKEQVISSIVDIEAGITSNLK